MPDGKHIRQHRLNRRDFLRLGGITGAASILASCRSQPPQTPSAHGDIAIRLAHISDTHVRSQGADARGFAKALHNIQALRPAVDLVLNTGDCVMDSLGAEKEATLAQWDVFMATLTQECSLPVRHAIGNHDVWGWGLPIERRQVLQSDPLFGKAMAVQKLGIPDRYYSFERGGWKFMILDSAHEADQQPGIAYTGKLDEQQFSWLEHELGVTSASTPVCVVSHIPILNACQFLDGDNEKTGNWVVPGAWVHIDARRLCNLLWQHPNVKLCLSGHTHQVEDLRYHGIKYLTDGAISANWWQGAYFGFPPGYVVVNLYADGSSDSEFVSY